MDAAVVQQRMRDAVAANQTRQVRILRYVFGAADDVIGVVVARWWCAVVLRERIGQHVFQPMRAGLMHAQEMAIAAAMLDQGEITGRATPGIKTKTPRPGRFGVGRHGNA